jgi:hypothetical protein
MEYFGMVVPLDLRHDIWFVQSCSWGRCWLAAVCTQHTKCSKSNTGNWFMVTIVTLRLTAVQLEALMGTPTYPMQHRGMAASCRPRPAMNRCANDRTANSNEPLSQ